MTAAPSPFAVQPLEEEALTLELTLCRLKKARTALEWGTGGFIGLIKLIEELTGLLETLASVRLDENIQRILEKIRQTAEVLVSEKLQEPTGQKELLDALKAASYDLLMSVFTVAPEGKMQGMTSEVVEHTLEVLNESHANTQQQSANTQDTDRGISEKAVKIKERLCESALRALISSLRRTDSADVNILLHRVISDGTLFILRSPISLSALTYIISFIEPENFKIATQDNDSIANNNNTNEERAQNNTELLLAYVLKLLCEISENDYTSQYHGLSCILGLLHLIRMKVEKCSNDLGDISGILTILNKSFSIIMRLIISPDIKIASIALNILIEIQYMNKEIFEDKRINNPTFISELLFREFNSEGQEYDITVSKLFAVQTGLIISSHFSQLNSKSSLETQNKFHWTSSFLKYPEVLRGLLYRIHCCSGFFSSAITFNYLMALIIPGIISSSYCSLLSSIISLSVPVASNGGEVQITYVDMISRILIKLTEYSQETMNDLESLNMLDLQDILKMCSYSKIELASKQSPAIVSEQDIFNLITKVKTLVEMESIMYDNNNPYSDVVERMCSMHAHWIAHKDGASSLNRDPWLKALKICVYHIITGNLSILLSLCFPEFNNTNGINKSQVNINHNGLNEENIYETEFFEYGSSNIIDYLTKVIEKKEIPRTTETTPNPRRILRANLQDNLSFSSPQISSSFLYSSPLSSENKNNANINASDTIMPFDSNMIETTWLLAYTINVINTILNSTSTNTTHRYTNINSSKSQHMRNSRNISPSYLQSQMNSSVNGSPEINKYQQINEKRPSNIYGSSSFIKRDNKLIGSPNVNLNANLNVNDNENNNNYGDDINDINEYEDRNQRPMMDVLQQQRMNYKDDLAGNAQLQTIYVSLEDVILSSVYLTGGKNKQISPVSALIHRISTIQRQLSAKKIGKITIDRASELIDELTEMINNLTSCVEVFVFYAWTIQKKESMFKSTTKWSIDSLYNEFKQAASISEQVLLLQRTNSIPITFIIKNSFIPEFNSLFNVTLEKRWKYLKREILEPDSTDTKQSNKDVNSKPGSTKQRMSSGEKQLQINQDKRVDSNSKEREIPVIQQSDNVPRNPTLISKTSKNVSENEPDENKISYNGSSNKQILGVEEADLSKYSKSDEYSRLPGNIKDLNVNERGKRKDVNSNNIKYQKNSEMKEISSKQVEANKLLASQEQEPVNNEHQTNKEISLIEYDDLVEPKEIENPTPKPTVSKTVQPAQQSLPPSPPPLPPPLPSSTLPKAQPNTAKASQGESSSVINKSTSDVENSTGQSSPTPSLGISLSLLSGMTPKEKLEAMKKMRLQRLNNKT